MSVRRVLICLVMLGYLPIFSGPDASGRGERPQHVRRFPIEKMHGTFSPLCRDALARDSSELANMVQLMRQNPLLVLGEPQFKIWHELLLPVLEGIQNMRWTGYSPSAVGYFDVVCVIVELKLEFFYGYVKKKLPRILSATTSFSLRSSDAAFTEQVYELVLQIIHDRITLLFPVLYVSGIGTLITLQRAGRITIDDYDLVAKAWLNSPQS